VDNDFSPPVAIASTLSVSSATILPFFAEIQVNATHRVAPERLAVPQHS
jgi:hypothetical protein